MSDDQGFTSDVKSEMVEINFIPLFPPKKYRPKLYINHLKLQPQKCDIHESVFINRQLIEELVSKFVSLHQEKIIYNNNNKLGVKYQNQLSFESNFENGNLEYVVEQNKQYHLYIRPDTNTKAHHQWFYFMIRNKSVRSVRMVIHNFVKGNMLYRKGLKPYYKSMKEGYPYFQQITSNVIFEEEETEEGEARYCLKFTYDFQHSFDEVEFCCQPPYTHLRLTTLLLSLPFKKIELARSVLGQKVHALLVNEQKNTRATVVVMARQHPGESVGSWMMQGLINRLQQIQSKIFWILIPMVNVDGVKMGNNRTGVLGHDFNRNWNVDEQSLKYQLFPELMGIIKYFKQHKKEKVKRVKMFIDLHGHSSQPNVFAYGPPLFQESEYFENSRLFPYMLSQANSNFKLHQCSFEISSNKKNCARSVFFNRLGFPYSYTIQSSFGIYNQRRINELDVVKVGEDICETIPNFVNLILSKNESKLKEMISDVKSLNLLGFNEPNLENSDSDYDETEPIRQEFEKKVSCMLADPQVRQQEIAKFEEEKRVAKQEIKELPSYKLKNYDLQFGKEKIRSHRTKTEDVKRARVDTERSGQGRRSSLFLPSINHLRMLQPPRKNSREPKTLPKNFSLRQVTERLLTLKHNKIGRRILILSDYPTAST